MLGRKSGASRTARSSTAVGAASEITPHGHASFSNLGELVSSLIHHFTRYLSGPGRGGSDAPKPEPSPRAGAVSQAMCSKLRVPCRFVTEHPCCKLPQDIGMLGR